MNRSRASGIVFGLIVIICSLLFLGRGLFDWNLGFLADAWWALLIIAVSVISMTHSGIHFWNGIFFVFGCCVLLSKLGLLGHHSSVTIFAVILLLLGVWIIISAAGGHSHHSCSANQTAQNCNADGGRASGSYNSDSSDYPDFSCVFSTYDVSSNSRQFRGGKASCVFGTMRLDLSGIDIEQHAVLEVSAAFSTLQIIMPRNIPYKSDVMPVLGTFQNYAPVVNPIKGAPFLEIKGSATFGRVELR